MSTNHLRRDRWDKAGYGTGMASALAALPPADSKFIRLYHLTSAEFALRNIKHGRLKVARYADLNDPFELLPLNASDKSVRKALAAIKKDEHDSRGIVCFSEDWASPVMWSHYADKHKGMCLGFDVLRTSVKKVSYDEFRGKVNPEDLVDPENLSPEIQEKLRSTKCHEWGYEREHRTIVQLADAIRDGDFYFLPFSENLRLTEVILGPNCLNEKDSVCRDLRERYPEAVTFKARLAFKYFQVVPDKRSV